MLEVNLSRYHTVNTVFPQRRIGVEHVVTYSEQQVAVMRLQPHPALMTKKIWSCEHFRMVTGDILLQMLYLVVVIHDNTIVEVVGNVRLTVFDLNSTLH